MRDPSRGWLILQTKPNQESVANGALARAGITVYYPQIRVEQTRARQTRTVNKAFLSRYIFVAATGGLGIYWLRQYSGVASIVRVGEVPAVVSDAVVEAIRCREVDGFIKLDPPPPVCCQFQLGQRVKITSGAHQGIRGVFQKQTGEQRAMLFLNLFGRTTRAEISLADLVAG